VRITRPPRQAIRPCRLIKESYEKQAIDLSCELEAQKMQLVANEERIASLIERSKPFVA
jgi:hypothetical protein